MATVPTHVTPASAVAERRAHHRKRLQQLAYVGFGPDTGGVLLDVSEEGLRCQIVGAVIRGDRCHLKFALPGRNSPIEADGQVVWSNKSGQGGGVRLVGLGQNAREELQRWVLDDIASNGAQYPPGVLPAGEAGAADPPQTAATDFAFPEPVAKMPVGLAAGLSAEPVPIEIEYRTGAETDISQAVVEAPAIAGAVEGTDKTIHFDSAIATVSSAGPSKASQTKPEILLTIVGEERLNRRLSRAFLLAAGFAICFAAVALYALQVA